MSSAASNKRPRSRTWPLFQAYFHWGWLVVAGVLVICALAQALAMGNTRAFRAEGPVGKTLVVFTIAACITFSLLGAAIATHLKEILGSPTGKLTPHLRWRNIGVALVVATVMSLLPLMVVAAHLPADAWIRAAAIASLFFSLAAYLSHHQSVGLVVYYGAVVLTPFMAMRSRLDPYDWLISWSARPMTMVAVSGAILALWLRDLVNLREESPEYGRRMMFNPRALDRNRRAGMPFNPSVDLVERFAPSLVRVHYSRRRLMGTFWGRAMQWGQATRLFVSVAGVGVFVSIYALVLSWFTTHKDSTSAMSAPWVIFIPFVGIMAQRRIVMGVELLRPWTRRQYFQAMFTAVITSTLIGGISQAVANYLLVVLGGFGQWPTDPGSFTLLWLAEAAILLGLFLLVTRWSFVAAVLLGGCLGGGSVGAHIGLMHWATKLSWPLFTMVVAGSFLLGAFLISLSYRRWMEVEILD